MKKLVHSEGECNRISFQGRTCCDYAWYLRCPKRVGFDEFEGFEED